MQIKTAGFTLIELLIVIAILGLVGLVAVPSITNTFRFSVQSTAREVATLVKDTSNSAQVTGKIHRVVYDLKNQQYWVESSSKGTLLDSDESKKAEQNRSSVFDKKETEEEIKKKSGFNLARHLTSKKKNLPVGVKFKDVYTEQSETPLTEGLVYTHIFPHGISEQTLVHFTDTGTNDVTLIISNLLGRCDVQGRYIDVKEAFPK
jgi:prepilin-type N-terminal cleavage/methylation domain-containing protein